MTSQETAIKLRKLGNSDLELSPIGLGCWQFSNEKGMAGKFWPKMDQEVVTQIVQISLQGGINWFDTAELYGKGQSEQMLAKALKDAGSLADKAHIATKWWPLFRTASSIVRTIDVRKKMLDDRTIHLYQIHQPYSFSSVASEMRAMASLVKEGKIQHVGVSNFSAKQMREADRVLREHGLRLVSNQVRYSLLDRSIEQNGILETAKELGIAIIAWSPLEQGILTGKFHKNPALLKSLTGPRRWLPVFRSSHLQRSKVLIDALDDVAQKYDVSASQVALNWLIHANGETVFAIPGASKVHHAEENIKAMRFTLTAEEIEMIDHISKEVLKPSK